MYSGTSDSGADDQVQDLFCKGDDDTAGKRQEALAALAGIMALQRQAHLNDAPAQQDQTDGTDDGEDEGTEVVDNGQRITVGKHRRGGTADQNQRGIQREGSAGQTFGAEHINLTAMHGHPSLDK